MLSEPRAVDRHLARNVARNYFTAPCQSWAPSSKSSVILACQSASPDRRELFDERRVDVFSSRRLFVLVFVHMDVWRWKDFDCLWKYLERRKYLWHRSWCGNNTYIWEHSQVIKRYKTNGRREWKTRVTLAAGRDDLKGNLSLFSAVSMRQSGRLNVITMDVYEKSRAWDDQTELFVCLLEHSKGIVGKTLDTLCQHLRSISLRLRISLSWQEVSSPDLLF